MIRRLRFFEVFEPQGWLDYVRVPWSALCWLVAWCVHVARGRPFRGRHDDLTPVWCPLCLWAGPRRRLVHAYRDDGTGMDVEPVDECPRCGYDV
jgi:hypothetical protein